MPNKNFTVYQLYFEGPLHIGDVRPDDYGNSEQFIRSDTMMAALTAMLGKRGMLSFDFNGLLPFQISSLFPFTTGEGGMPVYFFPKLMKRLPLTLEQPGLAKKMKKLKWLDKVYFEAQLGDIPLSGFGKNGDSDLQGDFCTAHPLGKDGFIQPQISQRVTIPRDRTFEADPTPFYMERLMFQENSGLYFLADGEDLSQIDAALDLLQYEGLGTDRSVGNGAFRYDKSTLSLRVPEGAKYSTNLSLFCPESAGQLSEMLADKASYDFLKRGGWITTEGFQSYRKKAIYMFTEGSVFNGSTTHAGRKAIDVTPNATFIGLPHKIWRNGHSIFLPVKM
ncbi:MAG TPA: type III-A CRISPR-associated RAMP protein Csm4 [Saprospiraceae bacterium]|nr:type III-A CRISPR-associated RAMP protein Csm4 [Saprospiraceae bacterium]